MSLRFNSRRLLEPIGNIPPVEHESAYYEREKAPAMLAGLKQTVSGEAGAFIFPGFEGAECGICTSRYLFL